VPAVIAVLALVAGAVAVFAALARDDGREPGTTVATTPSTAAPSTAPATTSPPSTSSPTTAAPAGQGGTGERPAGVPAGWVSYRDQASGYRVWHPSDWNVTPVDATRTDIRAPASGAYLRIDWTATPGDSPEAAWQQQSASFGARHEGYREIRIEPTTYKGYDAAEWEYSYTERGARLHAIDLGFVTGPKAYALNFQTREDAWASSQGVFEQFKAGFTPSE
jgi:hypothetical protein